MSETQLLENAVSHILKDYYTSDALVAAKRTGWCAELWNALRDAGMTLVSVPEEAGGVGGSMKDAAHVVRLAGRYCAPVPIADTALLAGWALARAALPVPAHPLAFVVAAPDAGLQIARARGGGLTLSGTLKRVPWARYAGTLVIVAQHDNACSVLAAEPGQYTVKPGTDLAGDARDDVTFEGTTLGAQQWRAAPPDVSVDSATERGAVSRALLMSGALDCILDMSVRYAKQRVQFGRPLMKFQALQQELARLAGDSAIATAAAMSAAASVDTPLQRFTAAIAKVRAGEAAQSGSLVAHQVHGAMGVTEEYMLHHSTLRLWSWRSEYGTEAQWSEYLGKSAVDQGSEWLWTTMTHY